MLLSENTERKNDEAEMYEAIISILFSFESFRSFRLGNYMLIRKYEMWKSVEQMNSRAHVRTQRSTAHNSSIHTFYYTNSNCEQCETKLL